MVDAEGERLGRLATKVAGLLQGKHRPDYSRHQLSDDFVIGGECREDRGLRQQDVAEALLPALRIPGRHAHRARWMRLLTRVSLSESSSSQ